MDTRKARERVKISYIVKLHLRAVSKVLMVVE